MLITGRLRAHPWRAAGGVLALAAVAVGVVWVMRPGAVDVPPQTHDPAKLAAATGLVAGLPDPAHAVRDAYATSCRVPAPYCATSTTESARSLVTQLEQALRSRGARVNGESCSEPEHVELLAALPSCGATLTYRGAVIGVGAGDARTGSAPASAYVYAIVPTDALAPPSAAPLPALARLEVTPESWELAAACAEPVSGGCRRYSGSASIAGDVDDLQGRLVEQLSAAGYLVDTSRCRGTGGTSACTVSASRFRTVGGRDRVFVVVGLRQTGPRTVTVRMSAES